MKTCALCKKPFNPATSPFEDYGPVCGRRTIGGIYNNIINTYSQKNVKELESIARESENEEELTELFLYLENKPQIHSQDDEILGQLVFNPKAPKELVEAIHLLADRSGNTILKGWARGVLDKDKDIEGHGESKCGFKNCKSGSICQKEEKLKEAISRDGYLISKVKNPSEELCLVAVRYGGEVLRDIEVQTEEIAKEAVKHGKWAIKFVRKQTQEIADLAFEKNPNSIKYIKPEFMTDEMKKKALMSNLRNMEHILEMNSDLLIYCFEQMKDEEMYIHAKELVLKLPISTFTKEDTKPEVVLGMSDCLKKEMDRTLMEIQSIEKTHQQYQSEISQGKREADYISDGLSKRFNRLQNTFHELKDKHNQLKDILSKSENPMNKLAGLLE